MPVYDNVRKKFTMELPSQPKFPDLFQDEQLIDVLCIVKDTKWEKSGIRLEQEFHQSV